MATVTCRDTCSDAKAANCSSHATAHGVWVVSEPGMLFPVPRNAARKSNSIASWVCSCGISNAATLLSTQPYSQPTRNAACASTATHAAAMVNITYRSITAHSAVSPAAPLTPQSADNGAAHSPTNGTRGHPSTSPDIVDIASCVSIQASSAAQFLRICVASCAGSGCQSLGSAGADTPCAGALVVTSAAGDGVSPSLLSCGDVTKANWAPCAESVCSSAEPCTDAYRDANMDFDTRTSVGLPTLWRVHSPASLSTSGSLATALSRGLVNASEMSDATRQTRMTWTGGDESPLDTECTCTA